MSITIVIENSASYSLTYRETSPNDPTTGTLSANSSTAIEPTGDNGPWTVSFTTDDFASTPASGVVPANSTSATVDYTIVNSSGKPTTTAIVTYAPGAKAKSQFCIDG